MTSFLRPAKAPDHDAHIAGAVSPREQAILWAMEEDFWTGGADKARATTAKDAVMIFPYPPGILQGDQIWHHLRAKTGWRSVAMAERRVTRCGDIAILSYSVTAEKPDVQLFKALCAASYLQDGDRWLRLTHQQTPTV